MICGPRAPDVPDDLKTTNRYLPDDYISLRRVRYEPHRRRPQDTRRVGNLPTRRPHVFVFRRANSPAPKVTWVPPDPTQFEASESLHRQQNRKAGANPPAPERRPAPSSARKREPALGHWTPAFVGVTRTLQRECKPTMPGVNDRLHRSCRLLS
jgi:hypothetical protein